jgi:hypothetical protein
MGAKSVSHQTCLSCSSSVIRNASAEHGGARPTDESGEERRTMPITLQRLALPRRRRVPNGQPFGTASHRENP